MCGECVGYWVVVCEVLDYLNVFFVDYFMGDYIGVSFIFLCFDVEGVVFFWYFFFLIVFLYLLCECDECGNIWLGFGFFWCGDCVSNVLCYVVWWGVCGCWLISCDRRWCMCCVFGSFSLSLFWFRVIDCCVKCLLLF